MNNAKLELRKCALLSLAGCMHELAMPIWRIFIRKLQNFNYYRRKVIVQGESWHNCPRLKLFAMETLHMFCLEILFVLILTEVRLHYCSYELLSSWT